MELIVIVVLVALIGVCLYATHRIIKRAKDEAP